MAEPQYTFVNKWHASGDDNLSFDVYDFEDKDDTSHYLDGDEPEHFRCPHGCYMQYTLTARAGSWPYSRSVFERDIAGLPYELTHEAWHAQDGAPPMEEACTTTTS